MFTTIIKWVIRLAPIMGTLEKDVTTTIQVVERDEDLMKKLKDAVTGLIEVLEEIAGVIR